MNDLLATFVPEARDLLQAAASGLLRLERSAGDAALVNEVFRALHTIKGSSVLFDAAALTRVAHAGEDLLDGVRAGRTVLTPDMVDLLLDSLDQLGRWIDSLEREGCLPGDADAVARRTAAGLHALMAAGDAAQ